MNVVTVETLPAVVEPTTPIRPSEALRLGRLRYPVRIENDWIDPERKAACAVGAIYVGYGWDENSEEAVDRAHLALIGLTAACPLRSCEYKGWGDYFGPDHPLDDTIPHLNDFHHWSDDQIVAWLQGLGL